MKEDKITIFSLYLLPAIFLSIIFMSTGNAETETKKLSALLTADPAPNAPSHPEESIYRKNNILFCTGESYVATENNNGAVLMQSGSYEDAVSVFKKALPHAPLFYPFLFNLGKSYAHLLDYNRAFLYLRKAQHVVPEYYLTYVEMGKTYQSFHKPEEAIELYRKAAHLAPDYLDAYILLGNAYLEMNRHSMAEKYYEAVLKKDPYYPNALLGKARLQFIDKKYYKAYMTLKVIDTEKAQYDKSYHYFYAESAYKLQRYQEAYDQYEELLKHTYDRFFLTTSTRLIKHKMELSKRFSEQEELQNEE